jgi:hypothetical protein
MARQKRRISVASMIERQMGKSLRSVADAAMSGSLPQVGPAVETATRKISKIAGIGGRAKYPFCFALLCVTLRPQGNTCAACGVLREVECRLTIS